MRLGTRISVTATMLTAVTIGIYGIVSVQSAKSDFRKHLEARTNEMGDFVMALLDGRDRDELLLDLARVRGMQVPGMKIVVLTTLKDAATQSQKLRLEQVLTARQPFGMYDAEALGEPYALMLPIRDSNGAIVCGIELQRDMADVAAVGRRLAMRMAFTLAVLLIGLALASWVTTRLTIGKPVERLLEGIDEVARGDLTRVILQERDDEIGALAGRFNAMTASLREAREETRRGVEERLELESRLRQSEKLAAVGQIAASIAHEVGTPLNVITGRARTMERKAHDAAEVAKNAAIIAEQSARIAKIIQQLLDYTRRRAPSREAVDLGRTAKATLDFLEHKIESSKVRATFEAEEGVTILGDPDQVQQVCMNIILNAIQAMPGGGDLTVRVDRIARRKEGLEHAPPEEYAVLEVKDTGVGIPEGDRERIFEPFYSTKEGEGTGLGLAVSHGIVKDHDGWIEVESAPQGGTTFRVYLPVREAERETAQRETAQRETEQQGLQRAQEPREAAGTRDGNGETP